MKTEENSDRSPRTEKRKVEINPQPKPQPQEPSSSQKTDIDGAVKAELDLDKKADERISLLLKEMEELAQKARTGSQKQQIEATMEIDKRAKLVSEEGRKRSNNPTVTLLFTISSDLQKHIVLPRPYSEISGYSDKVEKALKSVATALARGGADPDALATQTKINPETIKRIAGKVKR